MIDRVPRNLNVEQRKALTAIARQVMTQLELRRNVTILKQAVAEREQALQELQRSEQALRQSEATKRALLNATPDLMIRMNRNGSYLDFIPAKGFQLMQPDQNRHQAKIQEIMPPELVQQRMAYVNKALETGQVQAYEFEWVANGNLRYEEARISAVAEGEVLVIIRDITSRKQMEIALRQSEHRFRTLSRFAPVGIFLTDVDGNCTYVNDYICKLIQRPSQQLMGRQWVNALYPDDRDHVTAEWDLTAQTGREFEREYRFLRADGAIAWVFVKAAPLYDPDNRITGFIGAINDITDRKQAEQALRQSEATNRALISAIPDLLIRTSGDGVYLDFVSGGKIKLFNADIFYAGTSVYDSLPPNMAQQRMHHIQQALQTGELQMYEQHLFVDGKPQDEEVRIAVIGDNEVLLMVRDITERKQAERTLAEREILLRTILDSIPQGVFWKDRSGHYLGCNRQFALDAGRPASDVVGRDDFEMPWKAEAPQYREDDQAVIASGYPKLGIEEPITKTENVQSWLLTSKVPLRDANETIIGVLGVYEDITHRKQAEVALKRQLSRAALFKNITQEIRQSLDTQRIFQTTAACIGQTFSVNRCVIHAFISEPHPGFQLWGIP